MQQILPPYSYVLYEGTNCGFKAAANYLWLLCLWSVLSLQLFEANRVKFYMLNEVSEMIGHHGQVFRK